MKKLILSIILFLVSLLTVFPAPAYYLWLLAIAVSEFPLIFIAIVCVPLIACIWLPRFRTATLIFGFSALLLFLSPIVRAAIVAKSVKEQFDKAYHTTNSPSLSPFNFFKLFSGTADEVKHHTLTYRQDPSLNFDFYPAKGACNRPCVVVVHGGSWSSGDSKQLPELNSRLSALGYNVAAINYRHAPKYTNPAPVQDLTKVVNFLRSQSTRLHIDTNNFVVLGRSAGAQIALLYAYTQHAKGVKGVIDFYGPADMVWGYAVPANPLVMDSRAVMHRYLGGTYNAIPQKYAASSPIQYVNRETVPTLIIHGDNDVLVSPGHSVRLAKKLKENNIPYYYLDLPWATHGFDYNINGPGGQLSTYTVERFLAAVCR